MAKKAQERIYFKSKELVEQFKEKNPNAVLTRFIKDAADLNRTEWFGYDVKDSAESETQSNQTQSNVPEVA
jgi:hypothetical protein